MKYIFEGTIHETMPKGWGVAAKGNPMLNADFLNIIKSSSSLTFHVVAHPNYCCAEYDIRLNLLSFSRFYLPIKITVIGVPVSICKKGYAGDVHALIRDYRKRKGIYLVLNDDDLLPGGQAATGKTLPTCIFSNKYESFEDYMLSLRSSYRRRLLHALKKGSSLQVKKIENQNFTQEMFQLYLNVAEASKYPLELLNIHFFRLFQGDIFCFYQENIPVAFVLLKGMGDTLYFVFGGMDYGKRDELDLYYNMLLLIVQKGIEGKYRNINFGQTAEQSKLRIGCRCQNKYMHVFAKNKLIDFALKHLTRHFEYKFEGDGLAVFR